MPHQISTLLWIMCAFTGEHTSVSNTREEIMTTIHLTEQWEKTFGCPTHTEAAQQKKNTCMPICLWGFILNGRGPDDILKGVLDLDRVLELIQTFGDWSTKGCLFRIKVNVLWFTVPTDLRTQMSFILCETKVTALNFSLCMCKWFYSYCFKLLRLLISTQHKSRNYEYSPCWSFQCKYHEQKFEFVHLKNHTKASYMFYAIFQVFWPDHLSRLKTNLFSLI